MQCVPVLGGSDAGDDGERWEGETAETECHHGGPGRDRSQGEHWEISEGLRVMRMRGMTIRVRVGNLGVWEGGIHIYIDMCCPSLPSPGGYIMCLLAGEQDWAASGVQAGGGEGGGGWTVGGA